MRAPSIERLSNELDTGHQSFRICLTGCSRSKTADKSKRLSRKALNSSSRRFILAHRLLVEPRPRLVVWPWSDRGL